MISFIMPAKNAGKYIAEAICPLLRSEAKDWELIIVEDHSEDNTFDIVSDFCKKDNRIKLFRNRGNGKISGLNYGYSLSNGDIIKCIDADDVIDEMYFIFEKHNNCDAMCHDMYITFPDLTNNCSYTVNKKILHEKFEKCLKGLVSLPRCTWSFNRRVADKIFPLPDDLPFEDVWFSLIIKRYSSNINHVGKELYRYRQHENQTYAGILNFDKKTIIFRAKRMLRFIAVLHENRGRFSFDVWKDENYLNVPREYYSLLSKDQVGFRDILSSALPVGLKGKVVVSRKLNALAPLILKMKWILQK